MVEGIPGVGPLVEEDLVEQELEEELEVEVEEELGFHMVYSLGS